MKEYNKIEDFTKREQQILKFANAGATNQEIGDGLGLGLRGVQSHMRNIRQKARVKSIQQVLMVVFPFVNNN